MDYKLQRPKNILWPLPIKYTALIFIGMLFILICTQRYYLNNMQMNRPQMFVGQGETGNVQMIPPGNAGRNLARNQMTSNQRDQPNEKVIIIQQR